MSAFPDAVDVLGLEGTFPRPGWVALDAIRDRRFTGEVIFDTTPEVGVYADRGRIYLAERSTDPSLGARLVDAGALNATQLEHGAMRIGDSEHLGRLFERVPSVDRHQVLVTAELMTEECVGWLAGQRISGVSTTPYRHHPSGVHRWERESETELVPGDPLPAPAPDSAPVELGPPEPIFLASDLSDADDMIRWNEPSWLDEQLTPIDIAGRLAALRASDEEPQDRPEPADSLGGLTIGPLTLDQPVASVEQPEQASVRATTDGADVVELADHQRAGDEPTADEPTADDESDEVELTESSQDWIDRLGTAGLPERGSDPLASPVRLAPLAPEPIDRFELIWPSGDIDEQFGAQVDEPFPHPDIDRAGPTARLVRQGRRQRPVVDLLPEPEPTDEQTVSADEATSAVADDELERWLAEDDEREAITDEVVLAVRRAVASIETGSLAARRRLAEVPTDYAGEMSTAVAPTSLPGRVAVRSDGADAVIPAGRVTGSSVFDNLPPAEPPPAQPTDFGGGDEPAEPQRASALRRLIGSIRRR